MNLLEERILDLRGIPAVEHESTFEEKAHFVRCFLGERKGVRFVAAPSHRVSMFQLIKEIGSDEILLSNSKQMKIDQELLIFMEPECDHERRLIEIYLAINSHSRRTFVCL